MSILESIKIVPQGEIARVEFDLVGEKVNKFSTQVMLRLKEVLQELSTSSYKAVIFTSLKPKVFVAGADINEIKALTTKEQVEKAAQTGQEIINMVEDLPMLAIASINGACVGGGCEFVLACDYRIASDDPSTRIGLPETQLGILPGFGGCVRLPRVIGLQASLDVILAGKLLAAKKALKVGLIDKLVHPSILKEQTDKWVEQLIKEKPAKRRKAFEPAGVMNKILESPLGRGIIFSQAKKSVLKTTKGFYPAPLKALEAVAATYGMSNREKALRIERECLSEVAITDVCKNLIHVFFLTEMVKKQSGVSGVEVKPKTVKAIGILGAGTMGGGIAYVAADKGIQVRMKDLSNEALGKGLKHASDLWKKLLKKKVIDAYQYRQRMDAVSTGTDYSGFKNLDVVIEAIVEDMGIKQKVIAETAAKMRPDAIIATNTSSLSVTEMAQGHPHPEFFAGMHFFNPVHKMPLVEVIRGTQTSDLTTATIFELAKKMGKMPVVVKDGPGFLVNRLLLPYMAEAAFLLQEGMSIEKVDRAYVKEFGMPMGPFELMDEVGLDVCIKVLKIFKKSFGARIELAPCMSVLEKTGRLGRKNSQGFYTYSADGQRGDVDQSIYKALELPTATDPLTTKECIERGIFAMLNECSRALIEDKIVETPHEVDLAMIMGTGFPPFRGGLLRYADSIGTTYIADQLESYASQRKAVRLKPSTPLMHMARAQKKFYN